MTDLTHSRSPNTAEQEVVLPQSYATHRPLLKQELLKAQRYDIEQMIVTAAARICDRDPSEILVLPVSELGGEIARMRNAVAFEVVDSRSMGSSSPSSTSEFQRDETRISLVSVFLGKATGHRDTVVPYIVPHEHPDDAGHKIKQEIYEQYQATLGASPDELLKPRTFAALQNIKNFFNRNRKTIAACVAGVALVAGGTQLYTPAVNHVQTVVQQYKEHQVQHKIDLVQQLEEVNSLCDKLPDQTDFLLNRVTLDHIRALEEKILNSNEVEQIKELSFYDSFAKKIFATAHYDFGPKQLYSIDHVRMFLTTVMAKSSSEEVIAHTAKIRAELETAYDQAPSTSWLGGLFN